MLFLAPDKPGSLFLVTGKTRCALDLDLLAWRLYGTAELERRCDLVSERTTRDLPRDASLSVSRGLPESHSVDFNDVSSEFACGAHVEMLICLAQTVEVS